jgi:putative flippase GtrA
MNLLIYSTITQFSARKVFHFFSFLTMDKTKLEEGEKKEDSKLILKSSCTSWAGIVLGVCILWIIVGIVTDYFLEFLILSICTSFVLPFTCAYTWKKWEIDWEKGFIAMENDVYKLHTIWMGEIDAESIYINKNRLWCKANNCWYSICPVVFPTKFLEKFQSAVKNVDSSISVERMSTSFEAFLKNRQMFSNLPPFLEWKKGEDETIYYYYGKQRPIEETLLLQAELKGSNWEITEFIMSEKAWIQFQKVHRVNNCFCHSHVL